MAITVYWHNTEQTILCQSFVGTWTWADYDRSVDQVYTTIRSVDYLVHVIGDIRFTAPQTLTPAWPSFNRALRAIPNNMGLAIMVGSGYFATAFLQQLVPLFPHAAKRSRKVATVEDAYAIISDFSGCFGK